MTPREFLETVVQPNFAQFKAEFADQRHAFNAVTAVDSLMAHIFVWCQANAPAQTKGAGNDSAYRQSWATIDQDLGLVRDIAKAQKHVRLTAHKPALNNATQVSTRSLGWGEAGWDEGRWDGPPQVVVETNTGDLRVVEALVEHAIDVLAAEIDRLGIP